MPNGNQHGPGDSDNAIVIVLCGPPASGKGTQAKLLADHFDAQALSTGQLIRAQQRLGSQIGRLADEHLGRGGLLPDEPTQELLGDWLDQGHRRMILDGFPRNLAQARWLDPALAQRDLKADAVVCLHVPDEVLIDRTRRRWTCFSCGHSAIGPVSDEDPPACDHCGAVMERRRDDDADMLSKRLEAWNTAAAGLQKHYCGQGKLIRIPASGDPQTIHERILRLLRPE